MVAMRQTFDLRTRLGWRCLWAGFCWTLRARPRALTLRCFRRWVACWWSWLTWDLRWAIVDTLAPKAG